MYSPAGIGVARFYPHVSGRSFGAEMLENADFSNGLNGWQSEPAWGLSWWETAGSYRDIIATGSGLVKSGQPNDSCILQSVGLSAVLGKYVKISAAITSDEVSESEVYVTLRCWIDGKIEAITLGANSSAGPLVYSKSGWQIVSWEGVVDSRATSVEVRINARSESGNSNAPGMVCDWISLKAEI